MEKHELELKSGAQSTQAVNVHSSPTSIPEVDRDAGASPSGSNAKLPNGIVESTATLAQSMKAAVEPNVDDQLNTPLTSHTEMLPIVNQTSPRLINTAPNNPIGSQHSMPRSSQVSDHSEDFVTSVPNRLVTDKNAVAQSPSLIVMPPTPESPILSPEPAALQDAPHVDVSVARMPETPSIIIQPPTPPPPRSATSLRSTTPPHSATQRNKL